ncbi:hypothetical protein D3C79_1057370 [compost metagenome]
MVSVLPLLVSVLATVTSLPRSLYANVGCRLPSGVDARRPRSSYSCSAVMPPASVRDFKRL